MVELVVFILRTALARGQHIFGCGWGDCNVWTTYYKLSRENGSSNTQGMGKNFKKISKTPAGKIKKFNYSFKE